MTIPRTVDDLTPQWCSDALGRTDHHGEIKPARCRRRSGRPALQARARGPRRHDRLWSRSSRRRPTRAASLRQCSTCTAARSASTTSSRRVRTSGTRRATTRNTMPRRRTRCCSSKTCRRAGACSIRSRAVRCRMPRSAIRCLAKLHACFWDDASLDDAPFLRRLCDDPYPGAVAFAYETAWPRCRNSSPS